MNKKSNFEKVSFLYRYKQFFTGDKLFHFIYFSCSAITNMQWFFLQSRYVAIKVLCQEKGYRVKSLSTSFRTVTGLCHCRLSCGRISLIKPILWIASPAVVKSVRCGLLRTFIQLRSWY